MTFQLILFYIFAVIILYGALKTVTAKNPVHAALHLVLTFCVSAMLWMLMQAEFLGVTLVVVYVGAVMVLFLFVVMMLNIDIEEMRAGFWRHAPVAGVVGTLLAVALILILVNPKTDLAAFGLMEDIPADYNNIRDLGSRIYTDYLLPFELAAVLLLLGMVAAIALVHRKTTNPKRMDPADQVKVRADQGRMRLVKMEAVKPQVESAEESEVSDALSGIGCAPVRYQRNGYLYEPQKRAGIADVHRADALGGELQLYRLLPIFGRYCRTDFRIFRTDRCCCRIRHRFGDYGIGVP